MFIDAEVMETVIHQKVNARTDALRTANCAIADNLTQIQPAKLLIVLQPTVLRVTNAMSDSSDPYAAKTTRRKALMNCILDLFQNIAVCQIFDLKS
jgi:hypothetical protein